MSPTAQQVLSQALTLDEDERASVAGAILASLEGEAEPGVEAAWDAEIRYRLEELDSGAVQTIPWSEVRRRLFPDAK